MFKENKVTIFIVIIVFLIIFGLIYFLNKGERDNNIKTEYQEIEKVKDTSLFFSVSSNINKISEYVGLKDDLKLYGILNKNYLEENDINQTNAVISLTTQYNNTSFTAKEMYVVSKSKLYKYYVLGYLKNNVMDEASYTKEEVYYLLNYDIETSAFNVSPITIEEYNKAIKSNDFIFEQVTTNDYNVFEYITVTDDSLAIMYFNDFTNNLFFNQEYVFSNITQETKDKYFKTQADFNQYIKDYTDIFNNIIVKEYARKGTNFHYIDNHANKYIFHVQDGMNYLIEINFYSENS